MAEPTRCATCPAAAGVACPFAIHPHACAMLASGHPEAVRIFARYAVRGAPDRRLRLACQHAASWTGYGRAGIELVRALSRLGVAVGVGVPGLDERYGAYPDDVRALVTDAPPAGPVLQLGLPTLRPPARSGVGAVALTMWETNGLPPGAAANLSLYRGVIVPTRWQAGCFAAAGVTAPIRVAPLAVSAAEGHAPRAGVARDRFVVGMNFRTAHGGHRKGWREAIAAFLAAFDGRRDVRLELKVSPDCWSSGLVVPDDPRIVVHDEAWEPSRLAPWYRSLSAYLCASYGEGWCLPNVEAMACGTPLISTAATAMSEYHSDRVGWVVPHRRGPAGGDYAGSRDWFPPDALALAGSLRAAYDDWRSGGRELAARGEAAAAVASAYTWDRTAAAVIEALASFGLPVEAPVRTSPDGRVAHCGEGVWVGSARACDAAAGFDLAIHVAKDDDPEAARCRAFGSGGGLSVRYTEGASLATAGVTLAEIAAYARRPGSLLCHCVAGACRGPTMAVLALVARGKSPAEARELVRAATRRYGVEAMLFDGPMAEIEATAGRRGEIRATIGLGRRMRACPHFAPTGAACGCGRCALGRGRAGEVAPADCRGCPDLPP